MMTLFHRSLTGRVLLGDLDLIHPCWKKGASLLQRKLFECLKLGLVRHRKAYSCPYQYGCVLCAAACTWMNIGFALVTGSFIKCVKYRCASRYWQESSNSVVVSHGDTHRTGNSAISAGFSRGPITSVPTNDKCYN